MEQPLTINCISFNQDASCFTVGTNRGFRVYGADPLQLRFKRETLGGLRIVEALFKTNVVVFVGDGSDKLYPPTKVIIWDDAAGKMIGFVDSQTDVIQVRICKNKLLVVCRGHVYVYDLDTLKIINEMDTAANTYALGELSANTQIMVTLGTTLGHVHVCDYSETPIGPIKEFNLPCHDHPIRQIALSIDGAYLATASEKGTLIRIWDLQNKTKLQELRRGAAGADIQTIRFSQNMKYLCVYSNTGTIHLCALSKIPVSHVNDSQSLKPVNRRSAIKFLVDYIPFSSPISLMPNYFNSEWSFAQITLDNFAPTICAFSNMNLNLTISGINVNKDNKIENNILVVVTKNGFYGRYQFDPEKTEVKTLSSTIFIK
jgi:WD40 repeat protein